MKQSNEISVVTSLVNEPTGVSNPSGNQEIIAPVSVIIADDHEIFIRGIASVIEQSAGIKLRASFLNGETLLNWYDGTNADVLLVDLHMPILNGIETSKQLLKRFPSAKIIVLSADNDLQVMRFLFNLGVCSFLLKGIEPNGLIQTILKVHAGEKVFPENISVNIGNNVHIMNEAADDRLSAREIQVLKLIAKGKNNKEIAVELNISQSTVKKHRENMLRKLGATNMVQLILNVSFKKFL